MRVNTEKRVLSQSISISKNYHCVDNEYYVELEISRQFKRSMAVAQQKRIELNAPTAKYDVQRRQVYMEYPDGRKVYND